MKNAVTFLLLTASAFVYGQAMQVQNMVNYLRNKDLPKAKAAADAAAEHESTKSTTKMWLYRGNVYKAIYSDTSAAVRKIDPDAEEKALEAYVKALQLDKDAIYKDELKAYLIGTTAAVSNKANYYKINKEYAKAITAYDLLETALPYDFDGGIKRNNITKEKLMYNKFQVYKMAGDKEKTKDAANKLIDIKYKDPQIYTDLVRISLMDKDTVSALSYIEKGKLMFEDNMDLITSELDIYIARKKTDVLKDRLKSAIDVSPDNEVLHFVLANLYKGTNNQAEAEKEYLKAIELKADYEPAVYNLGVLYYSSGKEWNDKLNALPPKDPKTKEYETKSNEYFKKAAGYFETSFEITKDKRTKQILRQLYMRLGDTEKADKYK
jgi:predicted Zn-dependent protease